MRLPLARATCRGVPSATILPPWSPAPGPISTLHPILEQIEAHAASMGLSASVFTAAKEVFDKALADGWGEKDIASVHDQVNR